jgi:FkbM family methyltransferase
MTPIRQKLLAVANFLSVRGSLQAARRAPARSLTSLALVGRLKQLGVRPRVIVDVGANRGQFSSACVAYFPDSRVFAVEAIPAARARLEVLFAGHPNVSVVSAAVGARAERRIFHVNEFSHSSSFLPLHANHKRAFAHAIKTEPVELEIVALDQLIFEGRLELPDLLKLDVQGFELEVLAGAANTLPETRWIVLETAFTQLYEGERLFAEVHEHMRSVGYEVQSPLDVLTDPASGAMLQMDVLYRNARLAADRDSPA